MTEKNEDIIEGGINLVFDDSGAETVMRKISNGEFTREEAMDYIRNDLKKKYPDLDI